MSNKQYLFNQIFITINVIYCNYICGCSMKKFSFLSLIVTSTLFGAGYQIPSNSVSAIALSTANIANAHGADTSYYNPANMFYNNSKHEIELSLNYIILEPISYDSTDNNYHIKSEKGKSFIPSFHYVSNKLNDKGVRIGFSIVSPAGLSREWKYMPALATSKRYSLKTIEFNPSLAIPISNKLAFGFGFRYLKAKAEAELDGSTLPLNPPSSIPYTLNMNGEADAYGYNLALSYKATQSLNISATYRSKILFNSTGNADAIIAGAPISSKISTAIIIPANFILASAYKFDTGTTIEITYDRTIWSAVTETNFNFQDSTLETILGKTISKKWHDTIAYRVGITQIFNSITAMAGFSYSSNAADNEYVSFTSPESDTMTISLGARYFINNHIDIGLAGILAKNKARTLSQPTNQLGVNGTLQKRNIYVLTFGIGYKF